MKTKCWMVCMMLLCTLCAKAQVYLGGSLSFNSENVKTADDSNTLNTFALEPEVGYRINKVWSVGAALGLGYISGLTDHDTFSVGVSPYARATFARVKNVSFFAEAAYTYQSTKVYDVDGNMDTHMGTVGPGLLVDFNDHWQLVGRMRLLSYAEHRWEGEKLEEDTNFSLNSGLSLGIYYRF